MNTVTLPNDVLIPEIGRLLSEGREVVMKPKGNSMLPFIVEDRDSVVLKKLGSTGIGDIVLASTGGRYVLHRIIGKDGGRIVLMGDGNIKGTEACEEGDVLGTVIRIERGGRTIKPGKAALWRALRPVRRYMLAIYRRTAGRSHFRQRQ